MKKSIEQKMIDHRWFNQKENNVYTALEKHLIHPEITSYMIYVSTSL